MATINSNSDSVYIDMSESLELYDKKIINGRKEQFLYALCALDYEGLPVPLSRIELWLNGLVTGDVPTIEPQSRNEYFLKAILTGDTNNLPVPQSRVEVLLNKLANGETDLTDCEPIQSRYEFLLSYLIKNGGIGVEFVTYEIVKAFETLYNTKERPIKSAILKGNTYVNVLSKPCLKNTMTNVESQKLNHGYDAVNVVDGKFKSAILSGKTLVNTVKGNARVSNRGTNVISVIPTDKTKKYLLKFRINKVAEVLKESDTQLAVKLQFFSGSNPKGFHAISNKNFNVGFEETIIVEPLESGDESNFIIWMPRYESGELDIDILFIEYQNGMENWDIPYFEGMQSVKMPVLTTTGKNLFNPEWLNTKFKNCETVNGLQFTLNSDYTIKVKGTLTSPTTIFHPQNVIENLEDGMTYTTSGMNCQITNFDGTKLWQSTFTVNKATQKRIEFYYQWNTLGEVIDKIYSPQIEYGTVATSYEPYKTNILTVNEPVELRGIGDVQDELNVATGELTQRFTKIVLDGVNYKCKNITTNNDETKRFDLNFSFEKFVGEGNWITLERMNASVISDKAVCVYNGFSAHPNRTAIASYNDIPVLFIEDKTVLSIAQANQWLQQNPITIQYELKTPTIKTVDLTISNQDGVTQDKLQSFNDGHINLQSHGLLPTVNYTVPTNNSYYIQDTMKLNTQYTSKGSSNCNATIDGKVINLGSDATFITPSAVTDKLMVLDREVADLMFIEGNQVGKEIPYFTGMKSVVMQNKMPILHTVGNNIIKNSSDVYVFENHDDTNTLSTYTKLSLDANYKQMLRGKEVTVSVDAIGENLAPLAVSGTGYNHYGVDINVVFEDGTNQWLSLTKGNGIPANGSFNGRYYRTFTVQDKSIKQVATCQLFCRTTVGRLTLTNVQLEIRNANSNYEPYKTSILSCNEEVTLRGINNVRDELNLLTGEITEHIGELVCDGSRDWNSGDTANWNNHGNTIGFYIKYYETKNNIGYSDKLPLMSNIKTNDTECFYINSTQNWIGIRLLKSKLSELTDEGLKVYLQSNPITIQYQLATSTTKTVDLTIVNQDGQPTKLKTFNDVTYVETQAESVLPTVSLEYATKNEDVLSTLSSEQAETEESQNVLSDTIDTQETEIQDTMMALTEIYEDTL